MMHNFYGGRNMENDFNDSLKGTFLTAMPLLTDRNFDHTVTCICEYTPAGAVGIVVNRVHPTLSGKDISWFILTGTFGPYFIFIFSTIDFCNLFVKSFMIKVINNKKFFIGGCWFNQSIHSTLAKATLRPNEGLESEKYKGDKCLIHNHSLLFP